MKTTLLQKRIKYFNKKYVVAGLILIIASANIFAQDCAKVDKIDKFSNTRSIESEKYKVYGSKNGAAILLLTGNVPRSWGFYLFFTFKNNELFLSINDNGEFHYPHTINDITLKLSNNELISLKNFKSNGSYQKGDFSYEISDTKISKQILEKLITYNITDIRFDSEISPLDAHIDNSLGEKIKKEALCISSYLPANFSTQSNNIINNTQSQIESNNNNDEMPIPTNDTASVSLYKQWKLVAQLDSNGMPKDLNLTFIIQYSSDGTYKISIAISNGKVLKPNTGKFRLLNDDKVLIMTNDTDGKSSNAIITKLSKSELNVKSEKYQVFYIAY